MYAYLLLMKLSSGVIKLFNYLAVHGCPVMYSITIIIMKWTLARHNNYNGHCLNERLYVVAKSSGHYAITLGCALSDYVTFLRLKQHRTHIQIITNYLYVCVIK